MFGWVPDSAGQLASCFVEAGEHGAVDDVVTDLHPHATEQPRLDHDVEVDLAPVLPGQRLLR